jgi:hypothetical protein
MVGAGGDARNSGVARAAGSLASDGSVSAPVDVRALVSAETALPHAPSDAQPSLHDVDLGRGPRYGLLVGIVALISVLVPVTVFVVLRRPPETVTPGIPSEPASELQRHDAPRAKGVRGKNGVMIAVTALASASASAAPSGSASASASGTKSGPGGTRGGPFRR